MMKKEKNKQITIKVFLVTAIILLLLCIIKEKRIKDIKLEISNHYNKYVITNKDANIYININNVYQKIGKIAKNQELILSKTNIDSSTSYFKINSVDNYYIYYGDVKKIANLSLRKDRYKKYLPFNEAIITSNNTSFYDQDDNLIYQIKKSFTLPIIIKENDKYGIEYNNQLLYIKKSEIKEIKNTNTKYINIKEIPVLNYHFFYDANSVTDSNKCNQIICLSIDNLKKHLDYIKENNIFTPTMKELEMYIDKKINLPKSVVLTIDDGWRADIGTKIISQYKLNATVFLITNYGNKDTYENEYIEVHSHSNDLHKQGDCPIGQGGGIRCLSKNILLQDLEISRKKLNNTTVFCYPFYEYNNYSIEVLKEAGFTMAFGGYNENNHYKVSPGIDKFRLPRYIIYNDTTTSDIKKYIN